MEKSKKIKIFLGLFYLIVVLTFLYFFLSKFSLEELTSYEFIKNNREYFVNLKKTNLVFLSLIFLFSSIIWILMAGFASPLALLAGFIFGKWLGSLLLVIGMTIGATILYIFGNYFLKELIKEKFLSKFKGLELKFKKAEFIYLLAYRFIGGIPFVISNVLPCIFNVKVKNFFWATMIGIVPQIFLMVSIGSGIEKVIKKNTQLPKLKDLIFTPEIYLPLGSFFLLVIVTIFLRKIFYRK
jgi:uncharacterized membrane protein YdjX (TVP38/TMEM64 family)